MNWHNDDSRSDFWNTEKSNLEDNYHRQIRPIIEKDPRSHFSLFALAPQPLLIQLGVLFSDKIPVDVYQPIREPKTWRWQDYPDNFDFIVKEPGSSKQRPVLVFSISGKISPDRIIPVIGENNDVWEVSSTLILQRE